MDGFNLYYGCVKNTPYKWLNLKALFESLLLPKNSIDLIRYFTARVSDKGAGRASLRQQVYLKTIETIPEVRIHYGRFLTKMTLAPLADPPHRTVEVVRTEEKGSDVNLASYLLLDAFKKRYDVGVVVTNDTDLIEPIRIVTEEFGVPVGIISPVTDDERSTAFGLVKVASFVRRVREKHLRDAQFPNPVIDPRTGEEIHKPKEWP